MFNFQSFDASKVGIVFGIVAGLGVVLGFILVLADNKLSIKKDPIQVELEENILPGYNCGACGYPGCAGYADGLMKGDKDFTKCKPGGEKVKDLITKALG